MFLTLWLVTMVLILSYALRLWAVENREYKKNQRESAIADWLAEHDY